MMVLRIPHLILSLLLPHQQLPSFPTPPTTTTITMMGVKVTTVDTMLAKRLHLPPLLFKTPIPMAAVLSPRITLSKPHYLPAEICYKTRSSMVAVLIPICHAAATWQATRRTAKPSAQGMENAVHGHLHLILTVGGLENQCPWGFATSWQMSPAAIFTMLQLAIPSSLDSSRKFQPH
jgi:hypothetical protein